MKNILILQASPRKLRSATLAARMADTMTSSLKDQVEVRVLRLKELDLKPCLGCFVCLTRGEDQCPLKDRVGEALALLDWADLVVVVCPNYALQVPALLKNLFDRLAWVLHRPRFFGKRFTALVSQASYGGTGILNYLRDFSRISGFTYVPGLVLDMVDGPTPSEELRVTKALERFTSSLIKLLGRPVPKSPSLFLLTVFRGSRSSHKHAINQQSADCRHFREAGWPGRGGPNFRHPEIPEGPEKVLGST